MTLPPMEFNGVKSVMVSQDRWKVRIDVVLADGVLVELIASADAGYTMSDGIWFGTRDEYEAEAP